MFNTTGEYTRLEYFTENVAADTRRKEFDIKNHSLIHTKKRPDFLFIGDSITQYWELNAYFHTSNSLLINRGIAGDTTTYLKKRFFVDALQLQPKYCILGIGINDSIDLEGDYWKQLNPKPYDIVLSTAQKNISDIVQQSKSSITCLILTSLLPFSVPVFLHEQDRKKYVTEMNIWLKSIAKDNNLIFVDYYSAITKNYTDDAIHLITYDGLHPNALGYEIMADTLKNTLYKNNIHI